MVQTPAGHSTSPFPLFYAASLVIIGTIIVSPGCSAASAQAGLDLARDTATFASEADPILRAAYEAELDACFTRATTEHQRCVDTTRAKWAPIRARLENLHKAWCAFEPDKCPILDAGKE